MVNRSLQVANSSVRALLPLLLVFLLSSCGIFDTRDPEPPQTGSGYIWQDATTPDILLDNFEGTVEALDAENYKRIFISETDEPQSSGTTPSYFFIPSTSTNFPVWNTEAERNHISRLKSELLNNARLTFTLNVTQQRQTSTTRIGVDANYTIFIPSESGDVPNTVTGSMVLALELVRTERGTNEWRILSWIDNPATSETYTWTDLKARFGS